ncbi:hypothetical protein [Mycolicibacterium frederiksbergense]|uniref:Uncharacterized protein n=1 Tax=Mycolicibacterium frederiksbergense TaxID=117567 RepID=A0A6H0S6S4_9MYCO|nr:hypothetical protein [Mycolicibacterium frederiksbergense]QIV83048.1 hypothetical protein EXE63_20740 [Mycolicibacterium frederiksbergense]
MTDNDDDVQLMARVRALLESATASLDPADRAERIAWCREHDQHGVRMRTDPDGLLEFVWGGRPLALVRAADLDSDVPLRGEFVPTEIPDTLEGLTDD